MFKICEYYEKGQCVRNNRLLTSFVKTGIFAILFTIIVSVDPHTVELLESMDWVNSEMLYAGVMFFTILLVIAYRWTKWSTYMKPRTKSEFY